MDWSDWLTLPEEVVVTRMKRRLNKPIRSNDFIALYNGLIMQAEQDPRRVWTIGRGLTELMRKRSRPDQALLFAELWVRGALAGANLAVAVAGLDTIRGMKIAAARNTALELADLIISAPEQFGASQDQIPRALAAATTVLHHYGEMERLALVHLEAAAIYSRYDASQAAYRSLSDAEEIARGHRSVELLGKVYAASLAVGFEERDFEFALASGERALEAFKHLGSLPPPQLLANLAIVQMNADRHDEAIVNFERALAAWPSDNKAAVRLNLAACLRGAGRPTEARIEIEAARAGLDENDGPELRLELELVSARIASELNDISSIPAHMQAAAQHLDQMLCEILRLHHRRGVRERLLPRFESALRCLPYEGPVEDILTVFATIRGNAFGDWLSILRWLDAMPSQVAESVHGRAASRDIERLTAFGTPHLFGYREKYDDAWQPMNGGEAWDTLSELVKALTEEGLPHPLLGASLQMSRSCLQACLDSGDGLLAVTHAGEDPVVWCLLGDRYRKSLLPAAKSRRWYEAQLEHAQQTITRDVFSSECETIASALHDILKDFFSDIAESPCSRLVVLPETLESLPWTAAVLKHGALAAKMQTGEFEIRHAQALQPASRTLLDRAPRVVGISDPSDDLLLPASEGPVFADLAGTADFNAVSAGSDTDIADLLAGADVLIVSTHSTAITAFTDPYFAGLGSVGGRSVVGVEVLQQVAPRLQLSLVLLNACYSAVASGRNYQKSFRSADRVSFPALFALNGRAIASGSAWRTSDTAGYLHSALVGRALGEGLPASRAISRAIAELPALSKAEAIALLQRVPDDKTRRTAIARLDLAPAEGLFSAVYAGGGYSLYGLL